MMENETSGTALVESTEALGDTSQETTSSTASATHAAEGTANEETFISDAELLDAIRQDPKLNKFYGKMQSAYGKSREDLKKGREAVSEIERFYRDPAHRRQVLSQFAHELQAQEQSNGQASNGVKAPADLVERIKSSLAPELQWMAQQLADANWATQQAAMAPLLKKQEEDRKRSHETAYDEAAGELATKYPGWEESEQEMSEVLGWLQTGGMSHKRYGNRLEALYKFTQLLNGNSGLQRAEAIRATAEASRSRTVTGQAGRTSQENHTEKIRTAKTRQEAFAIAAKLAEEQARRDGSLPGS